MKNSTTRKKIVENTVFTKIHIQELKQFKKTLTSFNNFKWTPFSLLLRSKASEASGAEHLRYIVRNLPYHGI